MESHALMLLMGLIALSCCSLAFSFEPSPLQDFCVADTNYNSSERIGMRRSQDGSGLHIAGNTSNKVGSRVSGGCSPNSRAQHTYILWGALTMLHWESTLPTPTHPRATEILTVLEGTLHVGIVTSNPDNRLISKVLQKGDVFLSPIGLVHFDRNVGNANAVAIAALSTPNPGFINMANVVFKWNPPIADDVLARAFQIDKITVDKIRSRIWMLKDKVLRRLNKKLR